MSLDEVRRHLDKARVAREVITNAKLGGDLRDGWETFLHEYNRCLGKLISLAKDTAHTRALGHRLKNASQKDDEGLVFLREARNQDEHGLEPSARYEEGLTSLFGGAFGFGPNCKNIVISDCVVNGVPTGRLEVDTDETGRISRLVSTDPVLAAYTPASIKLEPIVSAKKKSTFPVPAELGGKKIPHPSPEHISALAIEFAEDAIEQYLALNKGA